MHRNDELILTIIRYLETLCGREFEKVADRADLTLDDVLDRENPLTLKIRREVVLNVAHAVERACLRYQRLMKSEYPFEFRKDDDLLPMGWMMKDRLLWKVIGNEDGCRYNMFILLFNHLWTCRLDQSNSQVLTDEMNLGRHRVIIKNGENKGMEKERYFVLLDKIDYGRIKDVLGIPEVTARYYIREFCKIGVLKVFNKHFAHGRKIYAIGYYHPYSTEESKNLLRPQPFLTKRMRDALMHFNPYRGKT